MEVLVETCVYDGERAVRLCMTMPLPDGKSLCLNQNGSNPISYGWICPDIYLLGEDDVLDETENYGIPLGWHIVNKDDPEQALLDIVTKTAPVLLPYFSELKRLLRLFLRVIQKEFWFKPDSKSGTLGLSVQSFNFNAFEEAHENPKEG